MKRNMISTQYTKIEQNPIRYYTKILNYLCKATLVICALSPLLLFADLKKDSIDTIVEKEYSPLTSQEFILPVRLAIYIPEIDRRFVRIMSYEI